MTNNPISRFLNQTIKRPNHPAILSGGAMLTYLDLKRLAGGVALHVVEANASRVLVFMQCSASSYSAALGCTLGGGIYTVVHVNTALEKLGAIVRSFSPDLILTEAAHVHRLNGLDPQCPIVMSDAVNPSDALPEVPLNEIAYVVFTCDAKGVPLGIEISRTALNRYLDWAEKGFSLSGEDRIGQSADLSVDFAMAEFYGTLAIGATLVDLSNSAASDDSAQVITNRDVTRLVTFPSQLAMMAESGELTKPWLQALRQITLFRKPASQDLLGKLFSALPNVEVNLMYGPPEATVAVACHRLTAQEFHATRHFPLSLGNYLPDISICFSQQPGQTLGELILSGPQLAPGYLGNTDRAKRVFRRGEDGEHIFRTRDIFERIDGKMLFHHKVVGESPLVG